MVQLNNPSQAHAVGNTLLYHCHPVFPMTFRRGPEGRVQSATTTVHSFKGKTKLPVRLV